MVILTIRAGTVFECNDCDFATPVKTELENHSRAWNHGTIGGTNEPRAQIPKSEAFDCYDCGFTSSVKTELETHLRAWDHRSNGKVNEPIAETPKSETVTLTAGNDCGFTSPVKTELEKHSRSWDYGTIGEAYDPRAGTSKSKALTLRAGTVYECNDCGFTSPVETELEKHSRAWDHGTIGEVSEPRTGTSKSEAVTIRAGTDCDFTSHVQPEFEKHSRSWDHGTNREAHETPKYDNDDYNMEELCEGISEDLFQSECPLCPFQSLDKSLYNKHLMEIHEIAEICNNESEKVPSLADDSGIWETETDHWEKAQVEAKKESLIEHMIQKTVGKRMKKPKKVKKNRSKRARHGKESFDV